MPVRSGSRDARSGGAKKRRPRQLDLVLRTWGGRRKGAGRKPAGAHAEVSHKSRPDFHRTTPVHVTLRMAKGVFNLRSRRSLRVIEQTLDQGASRFDVRIVQFSVQGNHIHFLVEARDKTALGRAIKGLSVRIAKGLNAMMGHSGRVLADRYHARLLRTPTEVRHVMTYIRDNHRNHMASIGQKLPAGWVDPYSSDSPEVAVVLPKPQSWLLGVGWQRGGP